MRVHTHSRDRAGHRSGAGRAASAARLTGLGLALGLVLGVATPAAASIDFQITSYRINPGSPGNDLNTGNCNLIEVVVKNHGSLQADARVRVEVVRNGQVEYMHGTAGRLRGGQTGTARVRNLRVPGTSGPAQVYMEVNPPKRLQSGGNSALPAPQELEGNRSNNTFNLSSVAVTGTCAGGVLTPRPERVLSDDQVKQKAEARRALSRQEQQARMERIQSLPKAAPQMHDISLYNLTVNGSNGGQLKVGSCNEVSVQIQNSGSSTGPLPGGLRMELYVEDKANGNARLYRHAGLTVPRLLAGRNGTLRFRNVSLPSATANAEILAIVRTGSLINDPTHRNNREVANTAVQGSCTGGGGGGGGNETTPPDGPSFTSTLFPTYSSPKCQTCHQMDDPMSPKFQDHVARNRLNANSDVTNPSNCQLCHGPGQGRPGPKAQGWKAPDLSMSFAGKSGNQLCQMTKSFGSASQVRHHLENDTLILWAIANGATPGSEMVWKQRVDDWVTGGMQCP